MNAEMDKPTSPDQPRTAVADGVSGRFEPGSRLRPGFAPRTAVLVVTLALLLTGCVGPGQGVADAIRAAHSPIVQEVLFYPANAFGRHEEIEVYVVDGTTEAQALDLWCSVIVPAGAGKMVPGAVHVGTKGKPGPGGSYIGGYTLLHDPVCP